jgi:hypothetical protein
MAGLRVENGVGDAQVGEALSERHFVLTPAMG